MTNDAPIIYDVPFQPYISGDGRPQFTEKEAQSLQRKMLRSKLDPGIVGKVVGYHGYREGEVVFYALDVQWNKVPQGYRSEEVVLFKRQIGKRFELLVGLQAKVAEREWVHFQLLGKHQGQNAAPHRSM